ncbi:hypothetical protein [Spiroplasma endosymbiont of Aleiodes alternator]|uniref:hypothetical protein n=1 Tax=Spiroplasma endosymbiont of Aleiodes alternator TaxID=3139329 RepID=UPI003CCAB340
MNTFLKVFLTQRLQFCVYFILDVHFLTRRINGHINNINEWDENDVQDINNSDREYLISNNNRNHDHSLIQCVTI